MPAPLIVVEASPVPSASQKKGVDASATVVLRINGSRRRLSPETAAELGRRLIEAAELGKAIEAAAWSL